MTVDDTRATRPTLARCTRDTPVAEMYEHYRRDGGVIVEGVLSPEDLAAINAEIDPHMALRAPGPRRSADASVEFHGAQTRRLRDLFNLSPTFRDKLIADPVLLDLVDAIMLPWAGSYWLTSTDLIQIGPGNKAQVLHRDQEVWEYFSDAGADQLEVVCNAFYALTDFTDANGATRVIPGSHRWEDYSETGTPEMTVPAEMAAGSMLMFSGKVVHGGGANRTADEERRGLAIPFNLGWLMPMDAHPFMIDRELAKTLHPRVQRLVGFRSHPVGLYGTNMWHVDYQELGEYLGMDGEAVGGTRGAPGFAE
jgi:ectoine hydroxylase-related dioxygenase (phytanoyl-CoA dioxygenase family)